MYFPSPDMMDKFIPMAEAIAYCGFEKDYIRRRARQPDSNIKTRHLGRSTLYLRSTLPIKPGHTPKVIEVPLPPVPEDGIYRIQHYKPSEWRAICDAIEPDDVVAFHSGIGVTPRKVVMNSLGMLYFKRSGKRSLGAMYSSAVCRIKKASHGKKANG